MRDEFTEWQDYARRGQLLKEDGTSSGQPHETALTISWSAWEARSKLTKPLGREQRRAMIEAAINDCDEEGLRPDMERFAWLIDAVERAHGIRAVQRRAKWRRKAVQLERPVIWLEQQEKNMSGGSFDYACYRTMQFADELRNKLQEQGKDPSGEGWPNKTWPTDVACKLSEIAAFADYVGALMKEAEWLYSGDTGEDTFTQRVREIEATRGVMRLERVPDNAEVSGPSTRPPC